MMQKDKSKGYGQRMRKLQNAFHVTAKYALRGVPEDEFVAYFPEAALPNEVVTMAYDGYRQCLHQARVFVETEFQEVCEETQIADKLQTLEVMCAQQGIVDGMADGGAPQKGATPARAARLAMVRAKREEVDRLLAILEEVKKSEDSAERELEEKKSKARQIVNSSVQLENQLNEFHNVATRWAKVK